MAYAVEGWPSITRRHGLALHELGSLGESFNLPQSEFSHLRSDNIYPVLYCYLKPLMSCLGEFL